MHDEMIENSKTECRNTQTVENTVAPLNLKPDDYRHYLNDFDLTEDQQNELLQTLWFIMNTMVDIGWGVDTVQMFFPDIFANVAPDSEKLVESKIVPLCNKTTDTQER